MPPVTEGKVAIFGAGPVGAVAARTLRDHYTLRLTDVRPIAEIAAEGRPQSPGAPLPEPLPPPHEMLTVDVSDYRQVREAARGMDALVNCTVLRHDPTLAFQVNLIGTYHIAKAAIEHGITRLINTGPQLVITDRHVDYFDDFDVPDDVPPRPGSGLYGITKHLGSEVLRVFAERHHLEVIEFVYCHFRPARHPDDTLGEWFSPFTTAWEDTGEPFLHALRAPSSVFERPLERFHITSRLPQCKFGTSGKAQRLLGWSPKHDFAHLWNQEA